MKNKNNMLLISIILSTLILFQIIFIFNQSTEWNLNFLKSEIILLYIIIVILSKGIYKKWEHPFIVILGTFFLFCLSRILLDLFGLWDLSISDKFKYYKFKKNIILETLRVLLLFLPFYFMGGVFYLYLSKEKSLEYINLKKDFFNEKIGKIFFLFGFIGSFLSKYKEYIYIEKYGYLSVYTGGIQNISKNYLEKFGITFLILGYLLIILSRISEKKFNIYSGLFLLIYFLDSLKGGRGNFLSMMIAIIIFKAYIYKTSKLKIKKIVIMIIGIVIFGSWINLNRSGYSYLKFDFLKNLYNFLRDQGVSLLVLSHFIEYKDQIGNNGVPFIIAPFVDTIQSFFYKDIYDQGQTENYVKICKGIGTHISYFLNRDLYLKGQGVGGNFLAEFYEFLNLKLIGVMFWSFFMGYYIPKIFDFLKKKKIRLIFLFLSLSYIIYIPRSSLFRLDYFFIIRIYCMYFIIILLKKIILKITKKG